MIGLVIRMVVPVALYLVPLVFGPALRVQSDGTIDCFYDAGLGMWSMPSLLGTLFIFKFDQLWRGQSWLGLN